ncbi:AAA family ATPase [Bermanella marisrubri]|uniref:Shikimate kinase n=1 Tax=Bermanella marisrubri TaxID=207949 RepID=Q1N319_9GAMM|nr:AAA family ATPase [Bermanella marisrubri]EAT12500.1 hypothetical protein RED65_06383 [Oceanobacter sp. RED65] [Bermanella marisrubri]QIZ84938.1 AAA family ATPase [Bermanella marisrubri]
MKRILIFGNSGSGKSTFAKYLSESENLAHLDLDTLAWKPITPPEREDINVSFEAIKHFTDNNEEWVIEGCYTDLLTLLETQATEIVFMNLSIEDCIKNAKARPWEPHKYESKQAQDDNLSMLIEWIAQYTERKDTFSYDAHQTFYDRFNGAKKMLTSNEVLK